MKTINTTEEEYYDWCILIDHLLTYFISLKKHILIYMYKIQSHTFRARTVNAASTGTSAAECRKGSRFIAKYIFHYVQVLTELIN